MFHDVCEALKPVFAELPVRLVDYMFQKHLRILHQSSDGHFLDITRVKQEWLCAKEHCELGQQRSGDHAKYYLQGQALVLVLDT